MQPREPGQRLITVQNCSKACVLDTDIYKNNLLANNSVEVPETGAAASPPPSLECGRGPLFHWVRARPVACRGVSPRSVAGLAAGQDRRIIVMRQLHLRDDAASSGIAALALARALAGIDDRP